MTLKYLLVFHIEPRYYEQFSPTEENTGKPFRLIRKNFDRPLMVVLTRFYCIRWGQIYWMDYVRVYLYVCQFYTFYVIIHIIMIALRSFSISFNFMPY